MSDEIQERIRRAQEQVRLNRAAASEAAKSAPAEAQRLADELVQSITSNLNDLLPKSVPVTTPMGGGASRRQFILENASGFKIQIRIEVSWTPGVGYAIGFPDAKISAIAYLGEAKQNVQVRFTNTLGKTAIDFEQLRADILSAADDLARRTA